MQLKGHFMYIYAVVFILHSFISLNLLMSFFYNYFEILNPINSAFNLKNLHCIFKISEVLTSFLMANLPTDQLSHLRRKRISMSEESSHF